MLAQLTRHPLLLNPTGCTVWNMVWECYVYYV